MTEPRTQARRAVALTGQCQIPHFPLVAARAASRRLLLTCSTWPKQQCARDLNRLATVPVVRGSRSADLVASIQRASARASGER